MAQMTVQIDGMTCVHCVRAVHTALAAVPGIRTADARLGSATIEHDGTATLEQVRAAVAVAGYAVREGSTDEGPGAPQGRRSLPVL